MGWVRHEGRSVRITESGRPGDEDRICCMGAAAMGRCTCWRTEYDVDQAEPRTDLEAATRDALCVDCACWPDSPERSGNEHVAHDEEALDHMVVTGQTFFCHQGMRRRVAEVHPDGTRLELGGHGFAPAEVDGVPYKADGTPADVCAGYARRRARYLRELEGDG